MGYRYFLNNPVGNRTDDCTVRALSKVFNISWDDAYDMLAEAGKKMGLMPEHKSVFSAVLRMNGFYRENLPTFCPECYSVRDFTEHNPRGRYVLCTDNHVVAVVNGSYFDSYDSGDYIIDSFWTK